VNTSFNFMVRVTIDNTDDTTDTDAASWNLTVGADRFPEFDVSSVQESWCCLGLAQLMHTGRDSFSISPYQYRTEKFIGAMNFECALGQAMPGIQELIHAPARSLHFRSADFLRTSRRFT
jgi:hypothetical protein